MIRETSLQTVCHLMSVVNLLYCSTVEFLNPIAQNNNNLKKIWLGAKGAKLAILSHWEGRHTLSLSPVSSRVSIAKNRGDLKKLLFLIEKTRLQMVCL